MPAARIDDASRYQVWRTYLAPCAEVLRMNFSELELGVGLELNGVGLANVRGGPCVRLMDEIGSVSAGGESVLDWGRIKLANEMRDSLNRKGSSLNEVGRMLDGPWLLGLAVGTLANLEEELDMPRGMTKEWQ